MNRSVSSKQWRTLREIRIQALKIQIQVLKIRIQALKIRNSSFQTSKLFSLEVSLLFGKCFCSPFTP